MKLIKMFVLTTLAVGICAAQLLPEGTKVRVRLEERLSSASATEGQTVELSVADRVVYDGRVVIPEGTRVTGTVVKATPKRRMGRAGHLDFSVDKIVFPDGRSIPLRYALNKSSGESHAVATGIITAGVAVFAWPVAPLVLLHHGKDISINKGMDFAVFTDSAYDLQNTESTQASLQ